MVMSSHQISAMAMQQQAMFGNAANYAQQIAPFGGGLRPYLGGYVTGVPPAPPPGPPAMPGYDMGQGGGMMNMGINAMFGPGQYMPQAFGEQLAGAGIGGMSSLLGGVSAAAQYATGGAGMLMTGAGGIGALVGALSGTGMIAGATAGTAALTGLPVVGGAIGALGGLPATGIASGLAAGAWMGGQVVSGFDQRQAVGRVMRNRFGGMGIGGGAQGGFSSQDIGGMSTMIREMAGNDMFTGFDELTRTLDRTGQMGLYRGVQSAREFRKKFKETVGTLKEIAKAMHSSIEEATQYMEGQRNMGFFSGRDITSSLMRTRFSAGASGMSIDQMQQIGLQGTQMGRMMGMRGHSGATAMQQMATNTGIAMRTGILSDEMVAEATGGLMGAEGAQAISGRNMQMAGRFFGRGAGRALLAGLWDPETGGVDQAALNRAVSGGMSFRRGLSRGRSNIRATGGRNSEFFSQQERIMGELMESGQGMNLMLGMMEQHYGRRGWSLDDPAMQRSLRRRFGMSQSEIELRIREYRNAPRMLEERRARFNRQMMEEARTRAREAEGVGGFRRRLNQMWERDVENPFRQAGDDLTTAISSAIEGMRDDLEGRLSNQMTEVGRQIALDLAATGRSDFAGGGTGRAFMNQVRARYGGQDSGLMAGAGRLLGMRSASLEDRIRGIGGDPAGMSQDAMIRSLTSAQAALNPTLSGLGIDQQGANRMGERLARLVTANPNEAGTFQKSWFQELFNRPAADPLQAANKRISMLAQRDPEFASLVKGKTDLEKVGIYRAVVGGRLKGRYVLPGLDGLGGGGMVATNLRALAGYRAEAIRGLGQAIGGQRLMGAGVRRHGGVLGVDVSASARAIQKKSSIGEIEEVVGDLTGLLQRAEEDPELYKQMLALGGPEGTEAFESAHHALALRAEDTEGDLDENHRKALREFVAASTGPNREGFREGLSGFRKSVEGKVIQQMILRNQKTGKGLRAYIDQNEVAVNSALGDKAAGELRDLLEYQSGPDVDLSELRKRRQNFIRQYGGTKEGQKLVDLLNRDEAGRGAYLSAQLQTYERFTKGMGNLRGLARSKMFLKRGLSAAGISGRNVQKVLTGEVLRGVQSGKISTEDLIGRLRDAGALGDVRMSEEELQEYVGRFTGDIQSGSRLTQEEIEQRGLEISGARAEGLRGQGSQKSLQDLPNIAQKQLDYLSKLVKVTTTVAEYTAKAADNDELLAAIKGINKPGGNTTAQGQDST